MLVDGQQRFKQRQINYYNGPFTVVVPIDENDRFLTLATTDGGQLILGSEAIYGDARLEMERKGQSGLNPSQDERR